MALAKQAGTELLVVAANNTERDMLYKLLQMSLPDCRIMQADDGLSMLALGQNMRPRIVLIHGSLKDISITDVTRRLLSDQPGVVVIVLTGFASDHHIDEFLNAGAFACIPKADILSQLVPLLRHLLSLPAGYARP